MSDNLRETPSIRPTVDAERSIDNAEREHNQEIIEEVLRGLRNGVYRAQDELLRKI